MTAHTSYDTTPAVTVHSLAIATEIAFNMCTYLAMDGTWHGSYTTLRIYRWVTSYVAIVTSKYFI